MQGHDEREERCVDWNTTELVITVNYVFAYAIEPPATPSDWMRLVDASAWQHRFTPWPDLGDPLQPWDDTAIGQAGIQLRHHGWLRAPAVSKRRRTGGQSRLRAGRPPIPYSFASIPSVPGALGRRATEDPTVTAFEGPPTRRPTPGLSATPPTGSSTCRRRHRPRLIGVAGVGDRRRLGRWRRAQAGAGVLGGAAGGDGTGFVGEDDGLDAVSEAELATGPSAGNGVGVTDGEEGAVI